MTGKQAVFSAGMYEPGSHFIDSHDDRAYKEVAGEVWICC
jgi:hypothetical protein